MISAYTDIWSHLLGDWKNTRTLRRITITRFDGKNVGGVMECGTVMTIPARQVYKDRHKTRFRKSDFEALYEVS